MQLLSISVYHIGILQFQYITLTLVKYVLSLNYITLVIQLGPLGNQGIGASANSWDMDPLKLIKVATNLALLPVFLC